MSTEKPNGSNGQSCRTCRYYLMLESRCRRYPPAASSFPAPPPHGSLTITAFPVMRPDGWCGEWSASLVVVQ